MNVLKSCVSVLFGRLQGYLVLWLSLTLLPLSSIADSGDKTVAASAGVGSMLGQMLLVLVLVLSLLLALAWILKRAGIAQGAMNGQLKVIGAVSVGQREKVVLVQVGQEQLVIGVTAGEISLLHLLAEPIDVGTGSVETTETSSFATKLQQALKRRHQPSGSVV